MQITPDNKNTGMRRDMWIKNRMQTNSFTKCSDPIEWYPFSQSGEPRLIPACERLSLSKTTLLYPIMTLSPVTN